MGNVPYAAGPAWTVGAMMARMVISGGVLSFMVSVGLCVIVGRLALDDGRLEGEMCRWRVVEKAEELEEDRCLTNCLLQATGCT